MQEVFPIPTLRKISLQSYIVSQSRLICLSLLVTMYIVPPSQLLPTTIRPCIPMYTSTKLIWLAWHSYDTCMSIIKKHLFLKIHAETEMFNSFNGTFMTDSKSTFLVWFNNWYTFSYSNLLLSTLNKWTFSPPWEWYAIEKYSIGQWYNLQVLMAGHNAYYYIFLLVGSTNFLTNFLILTL